MRLTIKMVLSQTEDIIFEVKNSTTIEAIENQIRDILYKEELDKEMQPFKAVIILIGAGIKLESDQQIRNYQIPGVIYCVEKKFVNLNELPEQFFKIDAKKEIQVDQEERTLYNEEIFGMSKFIQFANKNPKSLTANLLLKLGIISHNQKYYDNTPEKNEIIPNSTKSSGNPNSFHYSSELNTSQQNAEQIDRANFFQYQKIG